MRFYISTLLIFLIFSAVPVGSTITQDGSQLSLDRVNGVVLIDDIHGNDYTPNSMRQVSSSLLDKGYVVRYSSNFTSFSEGLNYAHYLVMSAPYDDVPKADIDAIKSWFDSGSRNLILASRGDFSNPNYSAINSILGNISANARVQDDNVYTGDSSAWRPWYIDTDNFNSDYSKIFSGVDIVSFFSPSSIIPGNSDVLVYAEAPAYQSNENGPAPTVVYDDTDDLTGGDTIPLATYETLGSGDQSDRVAVFGTTMWSDFDYGDSDAQDSLMFENLLSMMTDETIAASGDIEITLSDTEAPEVKILSPRDGATLAGVVMIDYEVKDPFGLESVLIELDGKALTGESANILDTSKLADGKHTFTVTATDKSGNTASVEHTYFVDQEFRPTLRAISKFMAYNIKESGIFSEWLDVVKEENPDVLILVETGNFDDSNNKLLQEVTEELNTYFIDEAPYNSYTLQGIENAWDGISLISRFEIDNPTKLDSLKSDTGSTVNIPLPFLATSLKVGTQDVSLIGAHLTCCPTGKVARALEQEAIINYMDELGDVPIVYMGDMNSESPTDTSANGDNDLGFEPIEMLVDSTHAKSSKVHTFTDVFRQLNPDDPGATYPSSGSRIDYIFTNQKFSGKLLNSTTGDTASASVGSDHYSVDAFIDLSEWTSDTLVDRFIPNYTISGSDVQTTSEGSPLLMIPFISFLSFLVIFRKRSKVNL